MPQWPYKGGYAWMYIWWRFAHLWNQRPAETNGRSATFGHFCDFRFASQPANWRRSVQLPFDFYGNIKQSQLVHLFHLVIESSMSLNFIGTFTLPSWPLLLFFPSNALSPAIHWFSMEFGVVLEIEISPNAFHNVFECVCLPPCFVVYMAILQNAHAHDLLDTNFHK